MKYLIPLFMLLAGSFAIASSPAVGPQPTGSMALQWSSTNTVAGILVSTSAATSIVNPSSTTAYVQMYRSVSVQNLCSGNDLYCGENSVALSTITGSSGQGWLVARSSGSYTFTLLPGENFYCESSKAAAGCWATVILSR